MVAITETPTYSLDGWVGNATDEFAVDWIVTEEDGWSSAAPVRMSTADRDDADGGVSGQVFRGPRLINLRGTAIARTRIAMLEAKERLRDVADTGAAPYPLTVAEAHLTRVAWVKHFDAVRIRDVSPVAFEFELALRADDPLRYDPAVRSGSTLLPAADATGMTFPVVFPLVFGSGPTGGSIVLEHRGTAAVYPVVSISGPVTNPMVRNLRSGLVSAFALTLFANDLLVIDHTARTVLVNGRNRRDTLLPFSSWWQIEPGNTEIRFTASASDGTPTATVTFRPAWK